MHILFLTDNFPPEVNAPASRTFEHCREWVKAGHQVTVMTCAPNFPKGRVYHGYKNKLWQREEMEGIRVVRVLSYITANEGFLRRTIDYMSFMASTILMAPFVRGVDLVIGTSPQFFTACAAYTVSTYKRVPFIFELRDLWPESIRAVGAIENSRMLDWLETLELFLYRRAAHIVSVTHSFRENLIGRGINFDKISVTLNGIDHERFRPCDCDEDLKQQLGLDGKLIAGYVGTHGMAHALETLLDAAEILRKSDEIARKVCIFFLGDGAEKENLKTKARENSLNNVVFVDSVPRSEVVKYWSIIDIAIIHLKKTPLFETVIPSKLFECMAMGLPILHGVRGESAAIVERENVGLTFEPENAAALASHLRDLAGNHDKRLEFSTNSIAAAQKYDRRALAAEMIKRLEIVHARAAS